MRRLESEADLRRPASGHRVFSLRYDSARVGLHAGEPSPDGDDYLRQGRAAEAPRVYPDIQPQGAGVPVHASGAVPVRKVDRQAVLRLPVGV